MDLKTETVNCHPSQILTVIESPEITVHAAPGTRGSSRTPLRNPNAAHNFAPVTTDVVMAHSLCESEAHDRARDPSLWFGGQLCPRKFSSAYDVDDGNRTLGLCFHAPTPKVKVTWTYCKALCKSLHVNASLPILHHDAELEFADKVRKAVSRHVILGTTRSRPGTHILLCLRDSPSLGRIGQVRQIYCTRETGVGWTTRR